MVGRRVAATRLTESLHAVTEDGHVWTGARACLAVGRLVPRWGVLARALDHRFGQAILEPVYRQISRHRHEISRLVGLPTACKVPR